MKEIGLNLFSGLFHLKKLHVPSITFHLTNKHAPIKSPSPKQQINFNSFNPQNLIFEILNNLGVQQKIHRVHHAQYYLLPVWLHFGQALPTFLPFSSCSLSNV
jgi:hypothetical protein